MSTSLKLGIDGGGTKTELVLVDAAGEIVAQHRTAGCNPSVVGEAAALEVLREAIAVIRQDAPQPLAATLLCMAGNRQFWREAAAALSSAEFGRVSAVDDSVPVLELATQGAPGLVLHAGTGSFVATRAPDLKVHYTGGLGWKLGDPGSGFDLGQRAIAKAMLELQAVPEESDGRARSALTQALCEHTGMDDYAALSRFWYSATTAHAQIAAFAPRVVALAAAGDAAALQVMTDSLAALVDQAEFAIRRYFPEGFAGELPCGLSGGILNAEPAPRILRTLLAKLGRPLGMKFITESPIEGVRRLLGKL